jgi:hypothetical protein
VFFAWITTTSEVGRRWGLVKGGSMSEGCCVLDATLYCVET